MSRNPGKVFEEQWKKSVPDYALLYRLPDPAQSFGGGSALRFSRKPEFDFLLWDSKRHVLYALEMKSVSGKSISFERSKNDKCEIHLNQIDGLNKWNEYDGITCGFVIEFRQIETTIFLDISDFNKLTENINKKSFTIKDLDDNMIRYTVIMQRKIRTRYIYNIDYFLKGDAGSVLS